MSRFWAAGGSSSESESSEDDSSYYSSDDSGAGGGHQNKWAELSDESDSEDEVRVVKSAKERAYETFGLHCKNIRIAMKQYDYYIIQTEFDELSKAMTKHKQVLMQGVPRSLVKMLVNLEDYYKERFADKDATFAGLSQRQSRALNRMKLTLRKHNKAYQAVITEYRKNPMEDDEEEDDDAEEEAAAEKDSDSDSDSSSSDSDSDDEKSDDDDSGDDDDDDDSSSGSTSSGDDNSDWSADESSSSSEDEDAGAYAQLKGRARWLKKNTVNLKRKINKPKDKPKKEDEDLTAQQKAKAAEADAVAAVKSILPQESVTPSILFKKVNEVASLRGRRGTDSRKVLRQLEALFRLSLVFGPRTQVPILMHVIAAQFDLQRTMDDYMETNTWKSCASYLNSIANVLEDGYELGVQTIEESDLILMTKKTSATEMKMKAAASAADGGAMAAVAADETLVNPHTGETETADERAERIRLEQEANMTEEELKVIPVVGSLSLCLARLEEEYVKSLQKLSPHTKEYVVRLRDESKMTDLFARMQAYFERVGKMSEAAALAQLRVEHIYYRHDSIAKQVDRASDFYEQYGEVTMLHPACCTSAEVDKTQPENQDWTMLHPAASSGKPTLGQDQKDVDFTALMAQLCTFVYKHGTEKEKTRAMICHVYHHAIHDRFLDARDLLLMSHLQETIYNGQDVSTMILFNRMMVNLGMSAFRLGRIYDAHSCLSEIGSSRVKELLAQGVSIRFHSDKSAEQEKAEKRRQVPYHQHINLDLLEACHLISAMLLEVPNMAAAAAMDDRRARVISRTFRKHHDIYDRQVFTGPPEQTRDYVMRASKALMKGDWKTCANLLVNLDVWKLIPGEHDIPTMLASKIKLEGLRTYLFAYSKQYDSLSLTQLCGMFEMTKNEVHSIVSKMMIHRELIASWDQPTETIVLRKVEASSLQLAALAFAEKAAGLVEANERLLDAQSGSYGYKDDHYHRNWKHHDGDRDRDYRYGNRGGYHHRGGGGGRGGGGRSGGRGGGRSGGRGGGGRGGGGSWYQGRRSGDGGGGGHRSRGRRGYGQ